MSYVCKGILGQGTGLVIGRFFHFYVFPEVGKGFFS